MVFCSMGVSSHGDTFNSWFDNYKNMFIQSQLYYLCFYPCNIFGINSWLFWILLIIIPFLCRLVFHILISLSSGFTKGLSVILILRYFVFRLLMNRLILSRWLFFFLCVCVCGFFFFWPCNLCVVSFLRYLGLKCRVLINKCIFNHF